MKKFRHHAWTAPWLAACALFVAPAASASGYETLSRHGSTVLKACNPAHSSTVSTCKVSSLPGVGGYTLVASRSAPIVINDIAVGTLQEKVWRKQSDAKRYIFGMRVQLNAEQWDASGRSFNINDLFRRALEKRAAAVAYFPDGASKALQRAGRTAKGLNEYDTAQPPRNNTYVDFRVDVNAADPDGASSASSPWLLLRTRARDDIELNPFAIRGLNSDGVDPTEAVEFFLGGYQPVGVPVGEEEEDEDDADPAP